MLQEMQLEAEQSSVRFTAGRGKKSLRNSGLLRGERARAREREGKMRNFLVGWTQAASWTKCLQKIKSSQFALSDWRPTMVNLVLQKLFFVIARRKWNYCKCVCKFFYLMLLLWHWLILVHCNNEELIGIAWQYLYLYLLHHQQVDISTLTLPSWAC